MNTQTRRGVREGEARAPRRAVDQTGAGTTEDIQYVGPCATQLHMTEPEALATPPAPDPTQSDITGEEGLMDASVPRPAGTYHPPRRTTRAQPRSVALTPQGYAALAETDPAQWRSRCLLALALLNHRADDSDVLAQLVRRALLGEDILALSSEQVRR